MPPTEVPHAHLGPRRSRTADPGRLRRLDRYFKISERGSTVAREVRGGFATFFAMAYIIVLNPIILGSAKDMFGHQLDNGQLVTATVLTAAFSTLLMGVIGNVPIALAAGLGVNTVVALQLAPRMSWPDAMGMVVLAGLVVMLLVATGLRERVMNAVPTRPAQGHRDRHRPVHPADRPRRLGLRLPHPGRRQDHRAAAARQPTAISTAGRSWSSSSARC